MSIQKGELREVYGEWVNVQKTLPEKDAITTTTWYHYQVCTTTHGEDEKAVNAFLRHASPGSASGPQHERRRSWVVSLPGLFNLLYATHTAEVIYETYISLPMMLTKKRTASSVPVQGEREDRKSLRRGER